MRNRSRTELRTRDRRANLCQKVDAAIRRIDEGEYGYCEVTGINFAETIGRTPDRDHDAEAQERHERREKVHRDD